MILGSTLAYLMTTYMNDCTSLKKPENAYHRNKGSTRVSLIGR